MILVLAVYFGMAYYLVEKMMLSAKHFEDLSKPSKINEIEINTDNYNIDLNIGIETNNVLYKGFMSVVNINNLDINKKILVCCTGDYQSVALLTIAFSC